MAIYLHAFDEDLLNGTILVCHQQKLYLDPQYIPLKRKAWVTSVYAIQLHACLFIAYLKNCNDKKSSVPQMGIYVYLHRGDLDQIKML